MNIGSVSEWVRPAASVILVGLLVPTAFAASNRELEQQLNAMDARVARMEKLMNNQVLLDMLRRLETLQNEIQQLRGDSERAGYELDRIKARQRELYLDVDRRLQQLGASASGDPSMRATTSAATSPPEKTTPAVTSRPPPKQAPPTTASKEDGRDAYLQAFNLLKDGRYDRAAEAFTKFLSQYPQSSYAANAQYWLAEANYVAKKYTKALAGFKKVVDSYPNSAKAPDANLKLGFTYYELEKWNEARNQLTEVRKQYPNTTVSRLADKRLQRMKKEGR